MKRKARCERLPEAARRTVFHDQVGRAIWNIWHTQEAKSATTTRRAVDVAKRIEPYVRQDSGSFYMGHDLEHIIERTRWWTYG